MKKLFITTLLSLPILASAGPVLSSELLVNGSFESDLQAHGTYSIRANLTGWTGGANGIELRDAVAGAAYDGNNFIELDVRANSSISQSFATTIGQSYLLTFAFAARPGSKNAASNGINWSAGDMSDIAFGLDINSSWTLANATFVATGNTTTLTFNAIGISDAVGTSLDDVSVRAIPEPASYALVLLGLAACGLATLSGRQARSKH